MKFWEEYFGEVWNRKNSKCGHLISETHSGVIMVNFPSDELKIYDPILEWKKIFDSQHVIEEDLDRE